MLLVQLLVDDVTVALAWQVELETVVEFAACAAFAAGPSGLLASISVCSSSAVMASKSSLLLFFKYGMPIRTSGGGTPGFEFSLGLNTSAFIPLI